MERVADYRLNEVEGTQSTLPIRLNPIAQVLAEYVGKDRESRAITLGQGRPRGAACPPIAASACVPWRGPMTGGGGDGSWGIAAGGPFRKCSQAPKRRRSRRPHDPGGG